MERILPPKSSFLYVPIVSGIWGLVQIIWEFSVQSFLAGFISGTVFGIVALIIFFTFNINSNKKLFLLTIISGFCGGIGWGLIYKTNIPLIFIGFIGSGISALMYLFEIKYIKKAV